MQLLDLMQQNAEDFNRERSAAMAEMERRRLAVDRPTKRAAALAAAEALRVADVLTDAAATAFARWFSLSRLDATDATDAT